MTGHSGIASYSREELLHSHMHCYNAYLMYAHTYYSSSPDNFKSNYFVHVTRVRKRIRVWLRTRGERLSPNDVELGERLLMTLVQLT